MVPYVSKRYPWAQIVAGLIFVVLMVGTLVLIAVNVGWLR
jgi:Protein of unknown function (DUF2970)